MEMRGFVEADVEHWTRDDFVEAKRRLRRTIHLLGKYPGLRKRARRYRWRLYTLRLLEGKLLGPISERGDPIQVLEEVKRGGRFREMFRLPVDAFEAIAAALLPDKVRHVAVSGKVTASAPPEVALAVFLHRIAYPNRTADRAKFWKRSPGWISDLSRAVLSHLFPLALRSLRRYSPALESNIPAYCERMSELSAGVIYGHSFLDGSLFKVARSSGANDDQRDYYTGRKCVHCFNLLGLVSPCGVIERVYGPYVGSTTDQQIYNLEQVDAQLSALHSHTMQQYGLGRRPQVIADAGFAASRELHLPIDYHSEEDDAPIWKLHNRTLSNLRISNEWAFGLVKNLWRGLLMVDQMQPQVSNPDQLILVSILLTNLWTCFEQGNQISKYFDETPSLT